MGSGGQGFAFGGAAIGAGVGSVVPGLGTLVGAQVGSTVGTLLGGILAKPKDPAKGGDARWGGCTYGTAISRGWGQHRTDAPVFWGVRNPKDGSYLFEHDDKKRKKAGSTSVAHYRATFAFMVLETGLTYGDDAQTQVERRIVVDRVWMADKIVWQSPSAVPIPAWSSATTYAYGDHVTRGGKTYVGVADFNLSHTPPSNSNAWWQRVSTGKNKNLTFHPDLTESTFTMAASSVMVSHDGVAEVPAFRGCTYGVADDVDLFDVGNALPQNVSVEWHWASQCYLRDLLTDACGLSGMPADAYDFSAIADTLTGYRQTARQSGQDLVGAPLQVFAFDMASVDGVVRAVRRGGAISRGVPLSDLGGVLNGGESIDLVDERLLTDDSELHSSLRLGYYDASAGFRQSFQPSSRNVHTTENPTDVQTDLVLTTVEAAQAAGRIHDTEWLEAGNAFSVSLLGPYSDVVSTDRIQVPYRGRSMAFRVVGTEFVQNQVRVKLARDEIEVLNRYEAGVTTLAAKVDDGQIVPTAFLPLSPATDLSNDFAAYPGFYLFANGPAGWMGGQVVYTLDPPTTALREWVTGPFVSDASTFGTMGAALADGAGGSTSPASPTLSASGGNASASLSWTASSGATSYSVRRGTASGGPYAVVQSGLTGTSFNDSGLTNGAAYHYVVTATNVSGESPPSNDVAVTPSAPATPPAAPQSVLARGQTGRVSVEWSPVSGATSYTVKRGTASGSYPDVVASGVTASSYVDAGRTNGTTLHYAVYAVNSVGTSAASPDAVATPIAKVGTVTAVAGNAQVALSWPAAAGATGYAITVTVASTGALVSNATSTGASKTVPNLTNGTTYRFLVAGTNAPTGLGDASDPVDATPSAGGTVNPQDPGGPIQPEG